MMRFAEWLALQIDRDDAVGDLAFDVRVDPPKKPDWGARDLLAHMRSRSACREAIDAASEAVSEWRAESVADSASEM